MSLINIERIAEAVGVGAWGVVRGPAVNDALAGEIALS